MFEFSWIDAVVLAVAIFLLGLLIRRLFRALSSSRRGRREIADTQEWDAAISERHRARGPQRRPARAEPDGPTDD
ncbi:hypothetical protein [Kribbella sp. DT2]|uniref:hypothetical protein n=1 Tax=Kribbella sp. DT2 TaxID=3393427 RepID=UPI003CE8C51C